MAATESVRPKPLLVYEGGCSFCEYSVRHWRRLTGDAVEYRPYQEVADQFPDLSLEDFRHAIRYIATDGHIYSGAHAACRTLAHVPGRQIWLRLYRALPPLAWLGEKGYRLIASYRPLVHRISRLLWGKERWPAEYGYLSWLFLRFLGVIYVAAFVSFAVQADGLIGSQGILPLGQHLSDIADSTDARRFWFLPTLFWFNASDTLIVWLPWVGAALSTLLVLNVGTRAVLPLLYVLYLSLYHAGQIFMGYQWDILLLEIGFLAILLPWWPHLTVWLFRWLTFRFVFLSGAVKLLSGDPAWADWTALNFHYETQPLPTVLAWFAHQSPAAIQKFSVGTMFLIELILPFFIFLPRRLRFFAAWSFIFLECLILLTGNYNFFNLLTIALCLLLFDDRAIASWLPAIVRNSKKISIEEGPQSSGVKAVFAAFTLLVVFLSGNQIWYQFTRVAPPEWANRIMVWTDPSQIVNSYGLFSVMTTVRNEIIVEGSRDGEHWEVYEFKYKPGDVARRPAWLTPHQPRLDWQMWFAALGTRSANPWFTKFLLGILKGSEPITRLLAHNPFPGAPPAYVRARFFRYEFTDFEARAANGYWWQRRYSGVYFPPIGLPALPAGR